jgi:hypothetical protein
MAQWYTSGRRSTASADSQPPNDQPRIDTRERSRSGCLSASAPSASTWSVRITSAKRRWIALSKLGDTPGVPRLSITTTANPASAHHCRSCHRDRTATTSWCPGPPYTSTSTGSLRPDTWLRG